MRSKPFAHHLARLDLRQIGHLDADEITVTGFGPVQVVKLDRWANAWGFKYTFLLCPCCGGRARVLRAGKATGWLCGRCLPVAYPTEGKPAWDLAFRRANKLRVQLGGEPGVCSPITRPRGMRVSKFNRLCLLISLLEERATSALLSQFSP